MNDEVLVKVENVSKKFCRSLKRSLWYGMQDMLSELNPFSYRSNGTLYSRDSASNRLRPDEFWAVKDVSFELRRGECLGLIGRNGAGKTTLLKMLGGLIKPDQGRITMRGWVGALIGLGVGFNPILSGRENIYVNGSVLGLTKKEIDDKVEEIIDFAELRDFIDSPVQSYSSGMQVRLGFAVATALRPDVLILDEVLAVGDAAFRTKCFNRMHEILLSAAVIFVSHNMQQLTRICNRMLLLQGGRVIAYDHNLGKVISHYHSLNATHVEMTVTGTGKTEIHSARLENPDSAECTTLRHGHPFRIAVSFTVRESCPASSLRLLLLISDEEQSNIAQVLQSIESPLTPRRYNATLTFARAPFNTGRYYLSLALLSGGRGELGSVVHNATSFIVENDISGYAPMWIHPTTFDVC